MSKVKIAIKSDEWYPVYDFHTEEDYFYSPEAIVEIDTALLKRLQDCMEEFDECQAILIDLVEKDGRRSRWK